MIPERFKSGGKGESAVKQAEREETEKFAQARKRKEEEENAPTQIDSEGKRYWRNSAEELHRDGDKPVFEGSADNCQMLCKDDNRKKSNL